MSPPPAHQPFLRAVCEAPDDDAPRLVFADYLDETGDPDRAEFIRLQVQLACLPDSIQLARRCEDLFRANGRAWAAELPGSASLWCGTVHPYRVRRLGRTAGDSSHADTWADCQPSLADWHRGFPATIYAQGGTDRFLSYLEPVTEFVPVSCLFVLDLGDPDGLMRSIAGLPFLAKLREIKLPGYALTDDAAVALARSPFATRLRQLSLFADRMTDRAGWAFADSPYLGDLEMLHLLHHEFTESVRTRLRARFGFRVHC